MDNAPCSGLETGHVQEFCHSLHDLFHGDRTDRQRADLPCSDRGEGPRPKLCTAPEGTAIGTAGDAVKEEAGGDNITIYLLAIQLLAGPLVIVVNSSLAIALESILTGYAALLAEMVTTGIILCLTVVAEGWLNEKITMVLSHITAIILTGLSAQYVIEGLANNGLTKL